MTRKPDVSAVLLSLGEPSVGRALASIERQSLAVSDIVRIEGVTPFHRALNEGAARVATEFFVQVDADMVLDDDCVERLCACTSSEVGAVIGMLRDPLYGRVEAIKLFRTAEVQRRGIPDSISPDTDFLSGMEAGGRYMLYALHHRTGPAEAWHTFGEHRPEYDALYTFERNKRDGRRLRHRGSAEGVRYHLALLHGSRHPRALLAEIGIAHGVFLDWEGDRQDGVCRDDEDFRRVTELLAILPERSPPRAPGRLRARLADAAAAASFVGSPERVFRESYQLGARLSEIRDGAAFVEALAARHRVRHPWAWLAQAALCRGLFAGLVPGASAEDDWRRLEAFGEYFAETSPLRLATKLGRARVTALAASLFGKR